MKKTFWAVCFSALMILCSPLVPRAADKSAFGTPGTLGPAGVLTLYNQPAAEDSPGFFSSLFSGWSDDQPKVSDSTLEAREFKLRIRELADQLLSTMPTAGLSGYIALPASFVNQDDFDDTSSFGRYIAEQLFYEFNQRGFPVWEYRYTGAVDVRPEGEFVLARDLGAFSGKERSIAFVTGTYFHEKNSTFVNARMIRGSDGLVLRTAHLIIENNDVVDHFFVRAGSSRRLPTGTMSIVNYDAAKKPPAPKPSKQPPATPVDLGKDIH